MKNQQQILHFKVAETTFTIDYQGEFDLRKLLPSYAAFHIKEDDEEHKIFILKVQENKISPIPIGKELGQFDCGGINHGIYLQEDGGYLILISNFNSNITCALRTSSDFSHCEASLWGDLNEQSFGINNAIMIAFAFAAAYHHIILMHASVPMHQGGGVLCLGRSGTGKSTHSQLWLDNIPNTELLNDDNPAVKYYPDTNETIVFGTPWSGKTPCYRNLSVPVKAFLRLEQYPENIISKEPGIKAFASILSSCSTMIWDKKSYQAICQTVAKIAECVPVFYLKCLPNSAAAQTSYQAIFQ